MKNKNKQGALTMPPPAKYTIVLLFGLLFFNALANMAQAQTLTLSPSNYNGTNISCFGAQDGSINLTITGGTPPYTIRWSNDAITEDISNLAAGFYMVEVDDADTTTEYVTANLTLAEPEEIRAELTASDYLVDTRHYNISLYGACNGSITIAATGGVAPYGYEWNPFGQTTTTLSNVCAGAYGVVVTDANGCTQSFEQPMTQPDRSDWQMTGNTGSNAATQFVGTLDNQDLSLRTYNQERLRIMANGDFKINSLAGTGDRDLYVNANGIVLTKPVAYWSIFGNSGIDETQNFIGPLNNQDLVFKTGDITNGACKEKMRISKGSEIAFFNGTSSQYDNDQFQIIQAPIGNPNGIHPLRRGIVIDKDPGGLFNFYIHNYKTDAAFNFNVIDGPTGNVITIMTIHKNGTIGIGTDPTANNAGSYKLVIGGKLGVKDDIYVQANAIWPDFVFEDNYKLPNLSDVAAYFKEYKHFKDFPSAIEVKTNGQAVGLLQVKQQEKLEQAYLYIIEHDKRSALMEKRIAQLEKRIAELEK